MVLREVLNKHLALVAVLILAIITLYLNSQYVSIEEYNTLKTRVENLENNKELDSIKHSINLNERIMNLNNQHTNLSLEVINRRLTTKINLIEELRNEIDKNENDIIMLKYQK